MKSTPKLSKTGKMPCKSWSLPAFYSCPGSIYTNQDYSGYLRDWPKFQATMKKDDRLPTCSGCYAMVGNYCYPNVKEPREHNMLDWQKDTWIGSMRRLIKDDRYFRFFDSGDIYCKELADKIYGLCKSLPLVNFWIPTLSWKNPRIARVLKRLNSLPNVVVRESSGLLEYSVFFNTLYTWGNHSTVIPESLVKNREFMGKGKVVCMESTRKGKCGDCRACWSKDVNLISYPAHGVSLKSKAKKLTV